MLLSVIVPIYGTEKYIERCARSLMEQSIADEEVEFIFVDDASPDQSIPMLRNILSQYPQRNARIIHNSRNLGLAATRFVGIDAARGEYIYNCDSDDWLDPDMLHQMLHTAIREDADIAACYIQSEFSDHSEIRAYSPGLKYETIENGLLAIKIGEAEVSLCNKIFRRSLLTEHNIRPYPGINMGEDNAISVRLRYFSRKTVIIPRPYYHYNITNPDSMSNRPKRNTLHQPVELARRIEQFFINEGEERRFRHLINWYKFSAKREYVRSYRDFQAFKTLFPEANRDIYRFNFLTRIGRVKWRFLALLLTLLPESIFSASQSAGE